MRPIWKEIYAGTPHRSDSDDQELIPVTRETLRLASTAMRKMNEDDYYHNNGAAEQEIIAALKRKRNSYMVPRQTTIEYDWSGYEDDKGMITVKKIVKTDIAKVYSQGEALALIEQLKKADAK